ncbi:hypothetical protein AVEN_32052-1 [Araneus ventricosus]|uniref:Uncharacterized protein n=1 Tax=Araneus ventricosus TaxID=182803 RepID=A0A4Y2RHH9_ARAVE|nr:hypothetical protein AVEN_32052-1 [Araneus ventricosus]
MRVTRPRLCPVRALRLLSPFITTYVTTSIVGGKVWRQVRAGRVELSSLQSSGDHIILRQVHLQWTASDTERGQRLPSCPIHLGACLGQFLWLTSPPPLYFLWLRVTNFVATGHDDEVSFHNENSPWQVYYSFYRGIR